MVTIGRYALHGEIASGGSASVHFGLASGSAGFRRVVAIKRLHADLAKDAQFRAMLIDEARLVSRIQHPNVVPVLDVVEDGSELCLVMDYVPGESLARLGRAMKERGEAVPPGIAAAIVIDVLRGLHAAHEATGKGGEPLAIVHRDVSPQNVLVGIDGRSRVVDFGIAKAEGRAQTTRDGEVKGKAGYMAPEQLRGLAVDRRSDVFATGTVLWELLCSARLFAGNSAAASMMRVLEHDPEPPSTLARDVPEAVDAVVLRALARDAKDRFATADSMADALAAAIPPSSPREVGAWVIEVAGAALRARSADVVALESGTEAPVGAPPIEVAPAAPRSSRGRRYAALAMAVCAAIALAVAGSAATRSADGHGMQAPVAAASLGAAAPSELGSPAPPASAPPADVPPEPPAANAPSTTPAPRTSATSRTRARPTSSGRPKSERCNPPYVVDPNGIHVMKPDCL